MDKKVELFKQWLYLLAGIALIAMMMFYNELRSVMVLLCLGWIILLVIEGKYFNGRNERYVYFLWALEYAVILPICTREETGMAILLVLLILGNIVLSTDLKISLVISIIGYVVYIIVMKLSFGELFNGYSIFMATVNFIITYILVFAIRYQILQREKVQQTAKELLEKTDELERAYCKLQELYEDQEEIILLKERNRISGEIHDTVGHRLTTAIVQLEASKRLMDKDTEKSMEKLGIAQNQVREGLQDIRRAVKAMKEGESILSFQDRVKAFIDEVAKNNDIVIEREIDSLPTLDSKLENVLFRGIQEGITNGLRHGKSSWFSLKIYVKDKEVNMVIKDRGVGCKNFKFGFGLNNMERKIKELNGTLKLSLQDGQGTSLWIRIPLEESNND